MQLMNYEKSNGNIIVEGLLPDDLQAAQGRLFIVGVWRHNEHGDPVKLPRGMLYCYDGTDAIPYAPVEKVSALCVKPVADCVLLCFNGDIRLTGLVHYHDIDNDGDTPTERFLSWLADHVERSL